VARRGAPPSELDFHSLTWLQYAYLQQGRLEAARAIMDTVRAVLGDDPAAYPDARYAGASVAFQFAAGTGRWEVAPSEPIALAHEDSRRAGSFAAVHEYQVAAAAAMRGDTSTVVARRIRSRMGEMPELQRIGAEIRAAQLEGLAARAAGDLERAIESFRATLSLAAPPSGPPYVIPSEELLGETLMMVGRHREAQEAYENALTRRPNRVQALLGLARARAAGGDRAGAAEAYGRLLASWHRADPDHPDLPEARRGGER
jgi:serine/threonine-protein kinase PknG